MFLLYIESADTAKQIETKLFIIIKNLNYNSLSYWKLIIVLKAHRNSNLNHTIYFKYILLLIIVFKVYRKSKLKPYYLDFFLLFINENFILIILIFFFFFIIIICFFFIYYYHYYHHHQNLFLLLIIYFNLFTMYWKLLVQRKLKAY